jgi:cell division control protein 6
MDVKTYLHTQKHRLRSQTSRVKDFTAFDFNYIPKQPIMRHEAKTIIDALLRYEHTGIPKNLAIFGTRGSGKTLMIRYLAEQLKTENTLTVLYCNIRSHNTSYKAIAHLLSAPARGTSLDELFTKFEQRYPAKTVVVLDEIDTMNPRDRNMEILYLLSRSPNNYMLILLSNNPRLLQALDESARSTLQPESMHFKNYDAHQIYEILKARAEQGLTSYEEEHLRRIAALTTKQTNSDVRVAIKSLFYLATETDLDVAAAFQRAGKDVVIDVIHDLNDRNLLILESARHSQTRYAKDTYQNYKGLSQRVGETPVSYMHFYNSLAYLQSCGLILLISTKIGRSYTNRIRLQFDPDIAAKTFRRRFGSAAPCTESGP